MIDAGEAEAAYKSYQCSRDFFDAVRDAAIEVQSFGRSVEAMERREGVHAQRYDRPMLHGGGSADAMAATDARIDFEEAKADAIKSDRILLDAAGMLIAGTGKGGIMRLCGICTATVIQGYYLLAHTWPSAAADAGISVKTAHRRAEAAMEIVDACGWSRIVQGVGLAEG